MGDPVNKGGRPPRYNNCLDFEGACELYFDKCKEEKEAPTLTGLVLALGFADKQSLYDYEKRDGFSCPSKRARLRVENVYENLLHGNNVAGSIFALKNMGWKDKSERELTGADGGPVSMSLSVEFVDPDD